ncbi:hypothetical protein KM043_004463 [Ampulex compressa]|nr:hypothetical protein KM043_004463 [Ampulex compressa]
MPTYEMPLFTRVMKKPELVAVLKRAANTIFNTGGFIRKIENLGVQELPYKIHAHGKTHKQASQFILYFDVPPKLLKNVSYDVRYDLDVIKCMIYKQNNPGTVQCTLEEELLPAPYRKDVQELLQIAKKTKNKKEFQHNSGLDYYPFQR